MWEVLGFLPLSYCLVCSNYTTYLVSRMYYTRSRYGLFAITVPSHLEHSSPTLSVAHFLLSLRFLLRCHLFRGVNLTYLPKICWPQTCDFPNPMPGLLFLIAFLFIMTVVHSDLWRICSKTPSGCLKPQIIKRPRYTKFLIYTQLR